MNLSARNQLKGKVIEVAEGVVTAMITIDIGGGNKITSTITMDALKDLGIKVGSEAIAIVKSSSVMVATE